MGSHNPSASFEPKILAFFCNWGSYRGADLAGTTHIQYPANVRIIRVMCSGSVHSVYVLRALMNGIDGVLIGGCHLGGCHYHNGNYRAMRRMEILKAILRQAGMDEDRVWLRWISASEAGLFQETVNQFVAELRAKGPSPMQKPWEMWQETSGTWKPQALSPAPGE